FSASASSAAIRFLRCCSFWSEAFVFFCFVLEKKVEIAKKPAHAEGALRRRAVTPQSLVFLSLASEKSALARSAPFRLAPVKSAPIALAKRRSASCRAASVKFAPTKSVPERSVSKARQPDRLARFRLAWRKLPMERSAREKLTSWAWASETSAWSNRAPTKE